MEEIHLQDPLKNTETTNLFAHRSGILAGVIIFKLIIYGFCRMICGKEPERSRRLSQVRVEAVPGPHPNRDEIHRRVLEGYVTGDVYNYAIPMPPPAPPRREAPPKYEDIPNWRTQNTV